MLQPLTRRALRDLVEVRSDICVSLFLPIHRYGPEAAEDRAQLELLLGEAERRLQSRGVSRHRIEEILAPIEELWQDPRAWKTQGAGMAMFAVRGRLSALSLERAPEPGVDVGSRFWIAPLLPLLPEVERFYVVALALQHPRVLEVTPEGVRRVELPAMPEGIREELGYAEYYSEVQAHSAGPGGMGRQRPIVHGHGDDDEERQKKNVLRYFRSIVRALRDLPDDVPRVLAAVAEHEPLFREAGGGAGFVSGMVPGSPGRIADEELAERSRPLAAERAREEREKALRRLREMGNRDRSVTDIEQVVRAAGEARVETLLVSPGAHLWGTYDAASLDVHLHSEREPDDEDLVDLGIFMTLDSGGSVLTLPREALSTGGPLAAILRY